jgi:hypothetical protein
MTPNEIIELAKQVGFNVNDKLIFDDAGCTTITNRLEAFAKLVAIHVSRELAKECAGMGAWNAVHIIEGVRW